MGDPNVNPRGGRYASALSNPILAAIADGRNDVADVVRAAARATRTRYELAKLFSDLACNLNGTDYLPFVTGIITGALLGQEPPPDEAGLVVQHNPDAAGNEASDATEGNATRPGRGE
jgi:hypothetical protein